MQNNLEMVDEIMVGKWSCIFLLNRKLNKMKHRWFACLIWSLTHKQLETNEYELSIVATDALVLKHQSISTYSAD